MEDLYEVLCDIRNGQTQLGDILIDIHSKLMDIESKIDDIQGPGVYNQISDVCDKLDDLERSINDLSI